MSDLLSLTHEHDLPPRWDGLAVVWAGWEYVTAGGPVFACPPRVEVCQGCGMPTWHRGFPAWSSNSGMVAESPSLTAGDFHHEDKARARLPVSARHKAERHWWRKLSALRCHHCSLDLVWEIDTDEMWVLDHTDYGDEGSVRP